MTMVSNAYKIKNTLDHVIVQNLVAGFTGQLKGWWDHYLDDVDRNQILTAIRKTTDGTILKDEEGTDIQNVVPTLIFVIAKYFLGDPSKLRDRTIKILINLRCKKLQDFRWYKDIFLTKVMTREDCNQPFQKEKFVAGLPTVFFENIRTKLRNQNNGRIPYDRLTYGDLINIINEEGLLLCSDLRLKQQIKKE